MDVRAELTAALAGRYRIERELGTGATAIVYLAHDVRHGRDVAIKVLRAELTSGFSNERFLREIRISAGLQHPHILSLFDSGEAAGLVYCVMPYVKGDSLRDRIEREQKLKIPDAIAICRQIASALTHAHSLGIIHRDIKPENILMDGDQAFVADFGISCFIDSDTGERLTQTGLSVGTPRYMSPEQAAGERTVDGRSDTYALACMTYEMLAGEPPFDGPSAQAIIARHMQQPAPSVRIVRPTVTEAMDAALLRGLAKVPADRFESATAFAEALEAGYAAGASGGTGAVASAATQPRARSRRIAIAVGGAAIAVAAGWAGWTAWTNSRGPRLDHDLIAIAPFDAADAALAPWRQGLLDLLARNLNGAGPLRVVPPSQTTAGWAGRADQSSAVDLATRSAAHSGIVGAIYPRGSDSVRITAAVYDASKQRLAGDVEVVVPMTRMDQGADSLTIAILGVLARERPLGATRPPSAGTNAIAALKAYLTAEAYFRRAAWDSAQLFYGRAGELDTNYALAFHKLAFVRGRRTSGIDSLIWFNGLRAGRLNRGLPERDSLIVIVDSIQYTLWYYTTKANAPEADSVSSTLRRRLFETLNVATRRYSDDAEIWYTQSANLINWGPRVRERPRQILDALNRAIATDSGFLSAYHRAIEYAARLDGPAAARQRIEAYIARNPPGAEAEDMHLSAALLDPRRTQSPETAQLLEAASARALLTTWLTVRWWYDSAETGVRVARRLAVHPDADRLTQTGAVYPQLILAMALASRGHIREACTTMTLEKHFILYAQLGLLGCPSQDSVAAHVNTRADRPNRFTAMYVPWWASVRDTARLKMLQRWGDSVSRGKTNAATRTSAQTLAASARAFLALARHDTAGALTAFRESPPDTTCAYCDPQRIVKSRLLDARGQTREAFAILGEDLDGSNFPFNLLLRLQRARLAEKLNERDAAIDDYRRVAQAWERGDPAMRDSARVAREGLQRLGANVR
jgi:tRNA A-37 threonylcarbamoyl transferase component Bud32